MNSTKVYVGSLLAPESEKMVGLQNFNSDVFFLFSSYEFHVKPRNPLGEGPSSNVVAFNTESGTDFQRFDCNFINHVCEPTLIHLFEIYERFSYFISFCEFDLALSDLQIGFLLLSSG